MRNAVIFADTNFFLHYLSIDQINWHEIETADSHIIVIPSVVIDELDKHKNSASAKIRERARKVISKLREVLKSDSKCWGNIRIEVADTPIEFDFKAATLDKSRADHQIIASALDYRANVSAPSDTVLILSADFGIELKSQRCGLIFRTPPTKYQLKQDEDPIEKENRELRKQNSLLLSRLPKLEVSLNGESARLSITTAEHKCSTDDEIVQRISQLKEQLPIVVSERFVIERRGDSSIPSENDLKKITGREVLDQMAKAAFSPSATQWANYNSQLERFYSDYESFLFEKRDYLLLRNRSLVFEIELSNSGTCPAIDTYVGLEFPEGVTLLEFEKIKSEPIEPLPPKKPEHFEMFANSLRDASDFADRFGLHNHFASLVDDMPNVREFDIDRSQGNEVSFRVSKLMHGHRVGIESVAVVFDSIEQVRSFSVKCSLISSELPAEQESVINIQVNEAKD